MEKVKWFNFFIEKIIIQTRNFPCISKNWKWFNLAIYFIFLEKGERLTKPDRVEGDIPLITAGENNNGRQSIFPWKILKIKRNYSKTK